MFFRYKCLSFSCMRYIRGPQISQPNNAVDFIVWSERWRNVLIGGWVEFRSLNSLREALRALLNRWDLASLNESQEEMIISKYLYLLTHSKYEKSDLLINKVTTFVENNNFGLAWWISKYQSLQYLLAISSLYSIHYHNLYYLLSVQYSMNESF